MSPNRGATAEVVAHPEQSPKENVEERLSKLLARVREDAKEAPDAYARDTEVPEGGE